MEKNTKFNRQVNDFLLTDLLPYEKGNHYTHIYFYEYLQSSKKSINKLIKKIGNENKFFSPSWHSAPLKFKILKSRGGFRELSLINPIGLIESLAFINLCEKDILNIMHNKNDFAARKAFRTNSLVYKKRNKQTVYYTEGTNSKKQLLISLESKGTYFRHYPFKTVTKLLNSSRFNYSKDKYNSLMIIDMQDCFSSIYTHSYKWLISSKAYDSKNLKSANSIYSNIDVFLQNLNGSKTNGIIVGPELSRLLAEFLFVHIDQQLIDILAEKRIFENKDYTIYRFVDDYYIYTNNQQVQATIREELANLLNNFQLKINESKLKVFDKNENINEWLYKLDSIISIIEQIFKTEEKLLPKDLKSITFGNDDLNKAFLQVATAIWDSENKEMYINKRIRYRDLRNRITSVLTQTQESSLISSYILSTILNQIEYRKDEEIKLNMSINELITLIFFIYSKNISYPSTQKVIRILTVLLEERITDAKLSIEKSIERFATEIFRGYPSDWIDLILFFSNYKIHITANLIGEITDTIFKEENPIQVAALCLFYEGENVVSSGFVRKVNKLIESKIALINWDDFFQDEISWWIFTFMSYPKISEKLKTYIKDNIQRIRSKLKNSTSDDAKRIILEFLLTNSIHFIEWKFTKDNYHKQFYFYTKDRTVFNPDIIDQIDISR
ncbi:RNA-directed DNA polymerase [Priestia megaterium]|uniref:RNA-directed DNA polymerase n=1 Tax=Priestia megaterium TaxID=1404 RepID=UPI002EAFD4B6|nr:RNA-directed DNA polymerase [Priestia megaterium]